MFFKNKKKKEYVELSGRYVFTYSENGKLIKREQYVGTDINVLIQNLKECGYQPIVARSVNEDEEELL